MMSAHQSALEARHANLDHEIAKEAARPQPDATILHRLKKEKLRIKETLVAARG